MFKGFVILNCFDLSSSSALSQNLRETK